MITTIVVLLVAFQLKHFVADYPLQTKYMLGKFKEKGWALPLLAHVAVHAAFTLLITIHYVDLGKVIVLAMFDASTHFVIDRVKASPKMLGRFKPLAAETYPTATYFQKRNNWLFWQFLGLDQFLHGFIHTIIIWYILIS